MAAKEAKARIKINKLLEESGWRFFDDANGKKSMESMGSDSIDTCSSICYY